MTIPHFKYYPNPLEHNSVHASDKKCLCCQRRRGYIYIGPVYAEQSLDNKICPWCIFNGEAHRQFNAEFTEWGAIGDYGYWEDISDDIKKIIAYQTPSFQSWQGEKWWTHCGDAALFLGQADASKINSLGLDLRLSLEEDTGLAGKELDEYISSIEIDGSPTVYLFQCRHCQKFHAYTDND